MPKRAPYVLFAADPGERTGVVVVRVGKDFAPDTATPDDFTIIEQDVLTVREIGDQLSLLVSLAEVVAYETWRLYPTHALAMVGNDMQPSQVIGMIRYEAWKQRRKVVSNGAAIKKVAVTLMPDWLREHMGKSSEQHDQDAIMHAWYVACNTYYRQEAKIK